MLLYKIRKNYPDFTSKKKRTLNPLLSLAL
jgi:hypothetical protein